MNPENTRAKEVVNKTLQYIETYRYDTEQGGFYGNTDVHGEDHYYGKNPRPADKPRIEKTKYTDRNAMALLSYLHIYKRKPLPSFKKKIQKTLDFYKNNIITSE